MLGHFLDQEIVGLGAAQALLSEGWIVAAQNLPGLHSQQRESLSELHFTQRLFGVLPVSVIDPLFLQQGDRLATGSSGLAADQFEHFWPPTLRAAIPAQPFVVLR
jgi:hypothetical protein